MGVTMPFRRCTVRRVYVTLMTLSLIVVIRVLSYRSDIKAIFKRTDVTAKLRINDTNNITKGVNEVSQSGDLNNGTQRASTNVTFQSKFPPPVPPRERPTNGTSYLITVPVSGKLGNQMFQYAALLGVAHLNGMTPFYQPASLLHRTFQVSHIHAWSRGKFTQVGENSFASYDPKFERLPQTNTLIAQYFQSWKYFEFIRDTIRKEFTFKENIKSTAERIINEHSETKSRTVVGVHVRRGDMLLNYHIKKGYHTAPASFLLKAMDYMRHKNPDVVFLVVTDDVAWCKQNLKASDVIFAAAATGEVHMAVLASCDHVIITVGTYGWWGGYLAGGEVVYYWDPQQLLHDPPLPVEITHPEDFFMPSWVPMTG